MREEKNRVDITPVFRAINKIGGDHIELNVHLSKPSLESFWMISSHDKYLLFPFRSKASFSIFSQLKNQSLKSKILWLMCKSFYHLSFLSTLIKLTPSVRLVELSGINNLDWKTYGINSNNPLIPCIFIGEEAHKQKAIVYVVNHRTLDVLGIVKFPLKDSARACVFHEANALQFLAQKKPGISTSLLHINQLEGTSTQALISGITAPRHFSRLYYDYLINLKIPGAYTNLSEHLDVITTLLNTTAHKNSKLYSLSEALLETLADTTNLHAVFEHCDFKYNNLILTKTSKIIAVDWEEMKKVGLPLLDLINYFYSSPRMHLNHDFSFSSFTKNDSWINAYCKEFSISERMRTNLALYYLLRRVPYTLYLQNERRSVALYSHIKQLHNEDL